MRSDLTSLQEGGSVSVDQDDFVRQATNATGEGSISQNWMRSVYGGRHDMNRPAGSGNIERDPVIRMISP
jgi:hypothetical protein